MSTIVVIAEPRELDLIPLAYQASPVIIAGVGELMINNLNVVRPRVTKIVNVGFCGATSDIEIDRTIKVGDPRIKIFTTDQFALSSSVKKNAIFDMEYERLAEWCKNRDIELVSYKTVSDHLSYEEYKENTDVE